MRILIGVTGGIAVYKVLGVIRQLESEGHEIRVIMTPAAAKFIQPILFKTLCHNEVYVDDFDYSRPIAHVDLADWSDVFAVVPATGNTIAKIANGIADNLLTSAALAATSRRIVFPSMNVHMYENPATQANIRALSEKLGYEVIEPDSGNLACGYTGKGRLVNEETIAAVITRDPSMPLRGKKFIVTAGGTIEKLDPVRYLSNFSSGRMGVEIAKALYRRGADVLLIYGNMQVAAPAYLPYIAVQSAMDMLGAIRGKMPEYDGLFMSAAVADYRPAKESASKIKKTGGDMNIELTQNPDVLKTVAGEFGGRLYVGFALETDTAEGNAAEKLKSKKLDYIVLNRINESFNPLGSAQNEVVLIDKSGGRAESGRMDKKEIAEWLIGRILPETAPR
jgi:phosphopantothenoylcysteine decarboxylase/phosphopantothenate--cysteine ligase